MDKQSWVESEKDAVFVVHQSSVSSKARLKGAAPALTSSCLISIAKQIGWLTVPRSERQSKQYMQQFYRKARSHLCTSGASFRVDEGMRIS
jgi:hypothetical protein